MALTDRQRAALASGRGKRKGRPNKITASLKEMILAALDGVGGQAYLEAQAKAQPSIFLTLVGKVLPLQVGVDGPGGPLAPRRVIIELEDGGAGAHEK